MLWPRFMLLATRTPEFDLLHVHFFSEDFSEVKLSSFASIRGVTVGVKTRKRLVNNCDYILFINLPWLGDCSTRKIFPLFKTKLLRSSEEDLSRPRHSLLFNSQNPKASRPIQMRSCKNRVSFIYSPKPA